MPRSSHQVNHTGRVGRVRKGWEDDRVRRRRGKGSHSRRDAAPASHLVGHMRHCVRGWTRGGGGGGSRDNERDMWMCRSGDEGIMKGICGGGGG
eukprot:364361-Chlamydomonas_euryale.AAC.4